MKVRNKLQSAMSATLSFSFLDGLDLFPVFWVSLEGYLIPHFRRAVKRIIALFSGSARGLTMGWNIFWRGIQYWYIHEIQHGLY